MNQAELDNLMEQARAANDRLNHHTSMGSPGDLPAGTLVAVGSYLLFNLALLIAFLQIARYTKLTYLMLRHTAHPDVFRDPSR